MPQLVGAVCPIRRKTEEGDEEQSDGVERKLASFAGSLYTGRVPVLRRQRDQCLFFNAIIIVSHAALQVMSATD